MMILLITIPAGATLIDQSAIADTKAELVESKTVAINESQQADELKNTKSANAKSNDSKSNVADDKLDGVKKEPKNGKKSEPSKDVKPSKDSNKFDLDKLLNDPSACEKYLNKAIAKKDWASISQLLPYYKSLTAKNQTLIKFAEATMEQSQGNYKPIIDVYKQKLAEKPEDYKTRLNLATALQADKQYAEAKAQFIRLQASDIPAPIKKKVERGLASVDKTEDWRFNINTSYLRDVNINNAPDKRIQEQLGRRIEQKSGNGISLSASANKRINLPKHFYAQVGANTSLKGYWDASDYNNYLFTAKAGIGYSDPKNDLSAVPFITKRIYNEEPYSVRQGVTLRGSRWLYPKFKVTATGVFSNEDFDKDKTGRRKTDNQSYSLTALYSKDSNEYFTAGITTQHNTVPETSLNNNDVNSFRIGWSRQWPNKISTSLNVSQSFKRYSNPATYYGDNTAVLKRYYEDRGANFGSVRKDETTSLGLQVWKKDFTIYGLMPRLILNYVKTDSNFPYYDDRAEKSATIMLTKSF